MADPLESLSRRSAYRAPLQLGPDHPRVLLEREIGGPEDPADRRLVLDAALLRQLLEVAENSLTGRVVLHRIGLRVQVLDDGTHRWEHLRLIGAPPVPELPPGSVVMR